MPFFQISLIFHVFPRISIKIFDAFSASVMSQTSSNDQNQFWNGKTIKKCKAYGCKGYKITKVIMNFKAVVLSFKDCNEKLLFIHKNILSL